MLVSPRSRWKEPPHSPDCTPFLCGSHSSRERVEGACHRGYEGQSWSKLSLEKSVRKHGTAPGWADVGRGAGRQVRVQVGKFS